MTDLRKPAIVAVTGAGLSSPVGRLCLLAASLALVLLPLVHLGTASAAPEQPRADRSQPLLPATQPVVPAPRTANERAIADIRRRIDLIDARIAAERIAEHARSADHEPAGDTSLTGPGPAPALAVTTGDTLQHGTAGQVQRVSDVVESVPAVDRQRPGTSPD